MHISSSSKRGSALLIVLGLLSFLMISAVAFSISMRTEHRAAAAYRQNLMARELLATAFTDARSQVEKALLAQRNGFDINDAATHTRQRLYPFLYSSSDNYARILACGDADLSANSASKAYLLDANMMRHIPPYLAFTVYDILERGNLPPSGVNDPDAVQAGSSYLDHCPTWKAVVASRPESEVEADGSTEHVSTAIIGRMTWAVVNISDALDINGIGSVSPYRGLGLTANEFAYGSKDTTTPSNEIYDLFSGATSVDGKISSDLPVFCSNADLSTYAAYESEGSMLNIKPGYFSWEHAVATQGDDWYSPFAVYSFWPSTNRLDEVGTTLSNNNGQAIACSELTTTSLQEGGSGASRLEQLFASTKGDTSDAKSNFALSMLDYVDEDSIPNTYTMTEEYANARPTVEKVPMVSEVSLLADGWTGDTDLVKTLKNAVEELISGASQVTEITNPATDPRLATAEEAFKSKKLSLDVDLKKSPVSLQLRTYFPGYESSTASFSSKVEWMYGIVAGGFVENESALFTGETVRSSELKPLDGGTIENNLFSSSSTLALTPTGASNLFELDKSKLPVANPQKSPVETGSEEKFKITLTFLIDHLFRVRIEGSNSDAVDLCPTDKGTSGNVQTYLKKAADRFNATKMGALDAQFFRATHAVKVEFALVWKFTEPTQDVATYTAELKLVNDKVTVTNLTDNFTFKSVDATADIKIATTGNVASYLLLSPTTTGTWFAVDPRYNWLSPMLGLQNATTSGYGSIAPLATLSSPHWIFENTELTAGSTSASPISKAYATANRAYIPFSFDLDVEDIRYGYNDTGALLLPAEVGFLPVPYATPTWHPNERNYLKNTLESYYNTVAKASFYRTLPIVDFNDGAMTYADYVPLTKMISGFNGKGFPEEHRSLVHAFAGQDNFLLAQRLRQLAMLGIPSSIRQSAYVSKKRLSAANSEMQRATSEIIAALPEIKDFSDGDCETPKYDTFIRDYLFKLPDTGGIESDARWEDQARPNTVDFLTEAGNSGNSFIDKLKEYNATTQSNRLGQNDATTLIATAKECFGDRQQLFLYLLRADAIAYNSGRDLAQHKPLSTARAVALVWRDAYGKLPDRVIYYQLLP